MLFSIRFCWKEAVLNLDLCGCTSKSVIFFWLFGLWDGRISVWSVSQQALNLSFVPHDFPPRKKHKPTNFHQVKFSHRMQSHTPCHSRVKILQSWIFSIRVGGGGGGGSCRNWPFYLQGQVQNNHSPPWWSSLTVKTHVEDLLLAYFACSYYEHMQCVCSQALKWLIPPEKQRSLRELESARLCRIYPCTWKDHLLQEQPRQIQTTQSAADVNMLKSSARHWIVKVWDKGKKKTVTTITTTKTSRRTHAKCLHRADSQCRGRTVTVWCVCVCAPLVQLEYSVLIHIKLKCENVFSHLLKQTGKTNKQK